MPGRFPIKFRAHSKRIDSDYDLMDRADLTFRKLRINIQSENICLFADTRFQRPVYCRSYYSEQEWQYRKLQLLQHKINSPSSPQHALMSSLLL